MAASKQVGYFRFELSGQLLDNCYPNLNSGTFLCGSGLSKSNALTYCSTMAASFKIHKVREAACLLALYSKNFS